MVTLHVLTIKYWRSREETSWITMEVCLSIYQNCIIGSKMNLVTDVISIWETRSVEWIRGEGELWLKLLSLNALLHMNMVCVLSIYSNYNFFFTFTTENPEILSLLLIFHLLCTLSLVSFKHSRNARFHYRSVQLHQFSLSYLYVSLPIKPNTYDLDCRKCSALSGLQSDAEFRTVGVLIKRNFVNF